MDILLTTVGEPTEKDCISAVKSQKYDRLIIVRNVSPVSRALNVGMGKCREEYVLHLSSDIMLYPNAIKTIEVEIAKNKPDYMCFPLNDWLFGKILGIIIFKRSWFYKIGGQRNVSRNDVDYLERLQKAGGKYVLVDKIIGSHISKRKKKELFMQVAMWCARIYTDLDWWSAIDTPRRLIRKIDKGEKLAKYALLGYLCGLLFAPLFYHPPRL